MKVEKNSFVTIDYLISREGRDLYPQDGQPAVISFCLGWGVMPPDLEEAMLGMAEKDHKSVHLTPEQAYGEIDRNLIVEVPRTDFDPQMELRPGLVYETMDEENHPIHFIIREVHPEKVTIDFNHPLAGLELDIAFTIRQVREATPEDLQHYHGCSHCHDKSHHH
ncbi:MAG: FKBP-type peptidyl-prolyl cis-trans isomerase [Thermodesulfobacteriota bacterium]